MRADGSAPPLGSSHGRLPRARCSANVRRGRRLAARALRAVSADLRLVGFEELSASALRERLLARRTEFWAGSALEDESIRALHDPLFFHQLGGFGAVALGPGDEDAGYLLGVVSADRLGVVHALAVHPAWRGRGGGGRLGERFAPLGGAGGGGPAGGAVRPAGGVGRCACGAGGRGSR